MKTIRIILLTVLCLLGGAPASRLRAQDVDVFIDWGASSAQPAQMISPQNGATLTSSTVTFQWTQGSGVEEYWLLIGTTPGGYNLVGKSTGLATSMTVTQLPVSGKPLYVTLY